MFLEQILLCFWPQKVLKEALLMLFLLLLLLLAGDHSETVWNEQKIFAMEQKMFLEQNYGID